MCGGMSGDNNREVVMRKEVIIVETGHNNVVRSASKCKNHEQIIYAVAATTGATGVVSTGLGSSADFSTSTGAAGVSGVASVAGFSRGATGVGSSIFGGFSSTLGGTACSSFGLDLKKPPTRADRRRVTFKAFTFESSSFYEDSKNWINEARRKKHTFSSFTSSLGVSTTGASAGAGVSVSFTGSVEASSVFTGSAAGVGSSFAGSSVAGAGT